MNNGRRGSDAKSFPLHLIKGCEVLRDQESLDLLLPGSIILCEIKEYEGKYLLVRTGRCCSGWFDFFIDRGDQDFNLVPNDDWTPELPVILIYSAPEYEEDF